MNKDFYNNLPGIVCEMLEDTFIPKYQKEEWFETAWEEYRQHVLNSNTDYLTMPYSIFKKYIKE